VPNFLVEETTVRECGESSVLDLGESQHRDLLLTLEVTHVRQHQELNIHILASEDGKSWSKRPVASFLEKMYCGTYRLALTAPVARYLKASWQVNGLARTQAHPLFRFCLTMEEAGTRAMAGAA